MFSIYIVFAPSPFSQSLCSFSGNTEWIRFENAEYKFFEHRSTWQQAQRICTWFGAELTSVHSPAELDFLVQNLQKVQNNCKCDHCITKAKHICFPGSDLFSYNLLKSRSGHIKFLWVNIFLMYNSSQNSLLFAHAVTLDLCQWRQKCLEI